MVSDGAQIKSYWETLPDKNRAFFLLYFNSDLGFCVIRTWIEAVVYCVPAKNQKVRFAPELLRDGDG